MAFGGEPGHQAIYHSARLRRQAVAFEHRTRIYTIAFVAPEAVFEGWSAAVNAMIDSVELL